MTGVPSSSRVCGRSPRRGRVGIVAAVLAASSAAWTGLPAQATTVVGAATTSLATTAAAMAITPDPASQPGAPETATARGVIVQFAPGTTRATRTRVAAGERLVENGRVALTADRILTSRAEAARAPGSQARRASSAAGWEAVAARLEQDPHVVHASPDYLRRPALVPEDEFFPQLWGLHNDGQVVERRSGAEDVDIDAPSAWDTQRGVPTVTVAVIDTGVQTSHPDLATAIWTNPGEIPGNGIDDDRNGYVDDVNGWDFARNDATVYDPADGDEHGTHVAGTIAATADSGGVVGAAFGVRVMPLKVLGPEGGFDSDIVEALAYAKAHGVKIANLSLSGDGFSPALRDAISASGMLVVAAAGNSADDQDFYVSAAYPGGFDVANLLQVAAVDSRGSLASFSNRGTSVDLAAPGVHILSTVPRDGYGYFSGTSMAAPHVSAVAALLLSRDATLDGFDLAARLLTTTKPLRRLSAGATCTLGLLDADAALSGFDPVSRLAGNDRYATAAEISQDTCRAGVARAYVASGRNFPDALAGAPAAALVDSSVVLVEPTGIPRAAALELARLKPQEIVVLGGPGAVTDLVVRNLEMYAVGGVVRRLYGRDRYATAAAISSDVFAGPTERVYLATGESFPDALAGAAIAGQEGVPILLTVKAGLPASTRAELKRLSPRDVVVLGGPGVVTDTVIEQARAVLAADATVTRVGGPDRFATAALVAERYPAGPPVAYLATGRSFPDALAGGALAALTRGPILLTEATSLPQPTLSALARLGARRGTVLGGTGAVSQAVQEEFALYLRP